MHVLLSRQGIAMTSRYDLLRGKIEEEPGFAPASLCKQVFIGGRLAETANITQPETLAMTPYQLLKLIESNGVY